MWQVREGRPWDLSSFRCLPSHGQGPFPHPKNHVPGLRNLLCHNDLRICRYVWKDSPALLKDSTTPGVGERHAAPIRGRGKELRRRGDPPRLLWRSSTIGGRPAGSAYARPGRASGRAPCLAGTGGLRRRARVRRPCNLRAAGTPSARESARDSGRPQRETSVHGCRARRAPVPVPRWPAGPPRGAYRRDLGLVLAFFFALAFAFAFAILRGRGAFFFGAAERRVGFFPRGGSGAGSAA